MKKVFYLILLMFFTFQYSYIAAQEQGLDDDQYVFWFYVRAEIKKDRELKRPVYSVRRIGKDVKGGTVRKFRKEVWRNMNSGQQLVVGPFVELEDAKIANKTYDLGRKTDEQMQKEIAETVDTTDNSYYWYIIQFSISKRTHRYVMEKQPARVAEGTLKDFRYFMWDVLKQQQLAIGPFTSPVEAEVSKLLYKQEQIKKGRGE